MNTYIAKSNLSINVMLPSGCYKHIAFKPKTGGGSVYYTESDDEIKGLESHPAFNRLYSKETADADKTRKTVKGVVTTAMREIHVNCVEDAKSCLCIKYGYSRTKLKSVAQIKAAAAEQGIVFVGI